MKLLTLARDLQRRKSRERHRLFVAEGIRAVEELLRSPIRLRGVLVSPRLAASPRGDMLRETLAARDFEVTEVGDRDFESAAETDSPQGVLAIAEIPAQALDRLAVGATARFLVLDAVQDPGNVGTMLRTAAALGASATIALRGTVDPWSAKVVRGAMGAQFSHPVISATAQELHEFRTRHDVALWGSDAVGAPLGTQPGEVSARLAIAVGNEGAGLSEALRASASRLVSIPMTSGVESLNVAVAAGILLYELRV